MADHERDNGQESRSEREQEAMQELARAILKEGGLVGDPEAAAAEKQREKFVEGGLEYYKSLVAYSKDMATLSGATLAGVTVVTKAFLPNPKPLWLLYASLTLLFFATLLSAQGIYRYTLHVRKFSLADVPTDTDEIEGLRRSMLPQVDPSFGAWLVREFWNVYWQDGDVSIPSLLYYSGLAGFVCLFIQTYF